MSRVALRALAVSALFSLLLLSSGSPLVVAQDATPSAMAPGTPIADGPFDALVEIDGRAVHVACVGAGGPAILFEPGGPNPDGGTADVSLIGPAVSAALGVRFCSYDRAGAGMSAPDSGGVRTFQDAGADLQAVLAIPELGCPCVVVAASLGGVVSLAALAGDPAGFGGLVLLDSPYPGFWEDFVSRAPAGSPEEAMGTDPYFNGENEEAIDFASSAQITLPEQPPAVPIVVISHGVGDPPPCFPCSDTYPAADYETAWQAGETMLAERLGAKFVLAEGTSHFIGEENPELVIGLVAEVIAAINNPSTLATPVATPA